ncbi:hypothetical protein SAY86_020407 [Trapa natans]|uniref:Uncharacterized protein n=1 Tax=Trapa natans TaxID=22666 RepID=A0AAN7LIZ6_TRANT|nr:hypothetical protein SAY86_020407 [Trapa natans]
MRGSNYYFNPSCSPSFQQLMRSFNHDDRIAYPTTDTTLQTKLEPLQAPHNLHQPQVISGEPNPWSSLSLPSAVSGSNTAMYRGTATVPSGLHFMNVHTPMAVLSGQPIACGSGGGTLSADNHLPGGRFKLVLQIPITELMTTMKKKKKAGMQVAAVAGFSCAIKRKC